MSMEEFKIIFDKPHAIYIPGETVTGKAFLSIDSSKTLRGIKIEFKGAAKVRWPETRTTGSRTLRKIVTGKEEYFNAKVLVLGSESGEWLRGEKIDLPSGTYTYPFKFDLPLNLPSSFESEFGHIRYKIKAVLDRPWNFDQETKAFFTVNSALDLNQLSYASDPVMVEESKQFCCLFCASAGPLILSASLPVKGYVCGQLIPAKIRVENQSGVEIDKVKFILRKRITYIASSSKKKIKLNIKELIIPSIGGDETVNLLQKLEVPSLPPSNLQYCNIINSEYELKIEACVDGFYRRNLIIKVPVVIGTVPIFSYEMPQPSHGSIYETNFSFDGTYQEVHTPSAPPIEESASPQASPASYEECIFDSKGKIRDPKKDINVMADQDDFIPRYPVYNFKAA